MISYVMQQVQLERARVGQKVVWVLVTDNEKLRRAAAQRFPGLVLTNLKKCDCFSITPYFACALDVTF